MNETAQPALSGVIEDYKPILVAPWFWMPFAKFKWWFIVAVGGLAAYSQVSEGHSSGSATALILLGWFVYAALYGIAGILTMLYIVFVLPKLSPQRFEALHSTGAQALIGPNGKGFAWGIISLLFFIASAIFVH